MSTKENVLALLEQNRGRNLSGEQLAERLGVSRTAVWKAVGALKKEGHSILASTNKGYCLAPDTDVLSIPGLLPFLQRKDIENLHCFQTLESTNQSAKAMAISGATHGTTVLANQQSNGRGRLGRQFFSPPGGIYLSVVLRPKQLAASQAPLVTAATGVAVCRLLRQASGKQVQIKWVNDLFLDNKKICGILTEAVTDLESGAVEWLVVGVGINHSTPMQAFPPELRKTAGSLFDKPPGGGQRLRLIAQLADLLPQITDWLDERDFIEEYRRYSMLLGKQVRILHGETLWQARALDIDQSGRLVVETADGHQHTLQAGEVQVLGTE